MASPLSPGRRDTGPRPIMGAARASAPPDARRWLILATVGLAQLMVGLDVTAINIKAGVRAFARVRVSGSDAKRRALAGPGGAEEAASWQPRYVGRRTLTLGDRTGRRPASEIRLIWTAN